MFAKNSYLIFHILQEVQEYNVSTLSQYTVSLNTMCTQHDDLNQLLSMPLNCTLHPNTLDPGPWCSQLWISKSTGHQKLRRS